MSFFKVIDKGAENTILAFSSISTPIGRFRFEKQLEKINVNAIYINCPKNSWYQHEIPGLGDNHENVTIKLQDIIKLNFSGTKLFAIGSSMGASGLITLASTLNIENAFAFCPEIFLFEHRSFSEKYYSHECPPVRKDIFNELLAFKNISLFYGEECENDLGQVSRISQSAKKISKKINITTFANEGHGVIEAIYLTEGIDMVIHSLVNNLPLRPNVIKFGDLGVNHFAAKILWRAWLSNNTNKDKVLVDLFIWKKRTDASLSYYPLILYWISKLTKNSEYIEEAFLISPYSKKIAVEYFSDCLSTRDERTEYINSFKKKYGELYIGNARAKPIVELGL